MTTLELMCGDKCFQEHPEKILGEQYETTGMRGTITKYKGTLKEAVAKINAPVEKLVVINVNEAPTVSVVDMDSRQPEKDEAALIVEQVEKNSKRIAKGAIRKNKEKSLDVSDPEPDHEMFTFEETFEQTNRIDNALPAVGSNRKISEQELRAFVWYMEQVNRKMSKKWYDLVCNLGNLEL